MNNWIKVLIILVFSISNSVLTAQDQYRLCQAPDDAFQSGERLQYALYYNWNFIWIPAGVMEFYIEESGEKYLIKVTGKTHESYNWFYKVDDTYHCIMDKNDFQPEFFSREIHEDDYHIYNEIIFDYAKDSVYSLLRVNDKPEENYVFPIENCVLDILSLSYKLRNIDIKLLQKQEQIDINLVFDENIFKIPIRYIGEDKSKQIRGIGLMNLHKISPDLIKGHVFREGQKMVIWVSQDGNRIPVMIESPIKVGSIKAILKNYENLKYPLDMLSED